MLKRRILIIILCLIISAPLYADLSKQDKLISLSFKNLAKTYLSKINLEALKAKHIEKIKQMNDTKFRVEFNQFYPYLNDLPPSIKTKHAISKTMTRQQCIEHIQSLEQKDIYELIENIPHTSIIKAFQDYLDKSNGKSPQENIFGQVHSLWEKIITQVEN